MIYLLDTNTLSAAINQNQDVIVQIEIAFANGHTLAISLITYFEIERGLELPRYQVKNARFKKWLIRLEAGFGSDGKYPAASRRAAG